MEFRFVTPDLRRWDTLKSEALSLALFSDDRPPRGPLGLVDWRLCGFLSNQLAEGYVSGERGETWLVPCRGRMPFEKLFIFGLGPRADFDAEVYRDTLERMLQTLTAARVRTSVIGLPGRPSELGASEAMDTLIDITRDVSDQDELILIEDPESQKTMERRIQEERRRVRASDSAELG